MKKDQPRTSKAKPKAAPRPPQSKELRLRKEIKQLKAERDQYKRSLIALMHEDIPVNKKELLALARTQRPLEELLAELEAGRV